MNNAFGNEAAFQIWFHKLLMYSFAETIQETYNDFGAIGKAVLKMVEAHFNVHISEAEIVFYRQNIFLNFTHFTSR